MQPHAWLVYLSRLSLPLPVFGCIFLFPHPRGHKPTAPFSYCAVPNPKVWCGGAPVPRDAEHPTIFYHAVRPFFVLLPDARFPALSSSLSLSLSLSLFLPALPSWVTCGPPCGAAPPPQQPPRVRFSRLFRCSHIGFAGGLLCRRGCGCSATCARLLGFEATSSSCDVLYGACCRRALSGGSVARWR